MTTNDSVEIPPEARPVRDHGAPIEVGSIDLDWQTERLLEAWHRGRDTEFLLSRLQPAFFRMASAGKPALVLDLACGEARHVPGMCRNGSRVIGLEPSPVMIDKALASASEVRDSFGMVRAIAERLPFREGSFDRVVCESSLDHFADPARGIEELAQVLRPGGDAVIGIVNYGGLGCRVSRLLYRTGRALRIVPRGKNLFWDTPVPHEHTFEGSLPALKRIFGTHVTLERASATSIFWGVPGWSKVLDLLPQRAARLLLRALDRVARAAPGLGDFLIVRVRRA